MSRTCAIDNKPLPKADDPSMAVQGWYCCDEYYCSEICLRKSLEDTGQTWEEHYEACGGDDGSDCYRTDWENEEDL